MSCRQCGRYINENDEFCSQGCYDDYNSSPCKSCGKSVKPGRGYDGYTEYCNKSCYLKSTEKPCDYCGRLVNEDNWHHEISSIYYSSYYTYEWLSNETGYVHSLEEVRFRGSGPRYCSPKCLSAVPEIVEQRKALSRKNRARAQEGIARLTEQRFTEFDKDWLSSLYKKDKERALSVFGDNPIFQEVVSEVKRELDKEKEELYWKETADIIRHYDEARGWKKTHEESASSSGCLLWIIGLTLIAIFIWGPSPLILIGMVVLVIIRIFDSKSSEKDAEFCKSNVEQFEKIYPWLKTWLKNPECQHLWLVSRDNDDDYAKSRMVEHRKKCPRPFPESFDDYCPQPLPENLKRKRRG